MNVNRKIMRADRRVLLLYPVGQQWWNFHWNPPTKENGDYYVIQHTTSLYLKHTLSPSFHSHLDYNSWLFYVHKCQSTPFKVLFFLLHRKTYVFLYVWSTFLLSCFDWGNTWEWFRGNVIIINMLIITFKFSRLYCWLFGHFAIITKYYNLNTVLFPSAHVYNKQLTMLYQHTVKQHLYQQRNTTAFKVHKTFQFYGDR